MSKAVYVSIGNSDDKLSQREWNGFYLETDHSIHVWADEVHGSWVSEAADPWQNACWCFVPRDDESAVVLRERLKELAALYRQDSVTWAEAVVEFLSATTDALSTVSETHRTTEGTK